MPHAAFPPDLVQAQRDWNRTYALLAEHQLHTTVLRCRLLDLSLRLVRHPFWATEQGRSPAARVELRRQVRAQEEEGETCGRSPERAAGEHSAVHHGVDS